MDRRPLYVMGQYQRRSARLLFCAWTGEHLYAMGQYQRPSARLLFCAWTGGRCMSWDSTNAPQHGYSSVHGQEAAVCHETVPTPLSTATLLCMDRRALYVMGQYQRPSARLLFCAWTGEHLYVMGQYQRLSARLLFCAWTGEHLYVIGQYQRLSARLLFCAWTGEHLYVMVQYQRPSARLLFCAWTGGRCMPWDSTNAPQHGYSSAHGQEVAVCQGTVPTPLSTAPLLRMDRRALYVMGQYQRPSARLLFCAWTGEHLYVMGQYQRPSARLLFCAWTGGR
ncbi:hypothetical protein NDU88_007282 [Pleurodeles waltl]|uniref:Uncharacterized protein n=1 Tax=Pleurodeles waltl TaxID=8319 RepID=A0AAV7MPT9_PLEWA|nr:hypothetical protein NDU88_007282 [Pleurodeles waltl]